MYDQMSTSTYNHTRNTCAARSTLCLARLSRGMGICLRGVVRPTHWTLGIWAALALACQTHLPPRRPPTPST